MQPIERNIYFIQIFAAICLGISYFLPFYTSAVGEVNYAKNEWIFFFWAIPLVTIIFTLSNRWLKVIFCMLASIGGLFPLALLTFVATFKSTPLTGFHIARLSILILVISWLVLGVVTLGKPKTDKTKASLQTQVEKRILYILLGVFITLIVVAISWVIVMKVPVLHAQYVKLSNDPEVVLNTFFLALVDDDIALAKKLATPEAQKRIDAWKIESQHETVKCFRSNLIEMYATSSISNVTYTSANQAVSEIMKYSCMYGDRHSLSLWGATLEYNGREWLISDWNKICEQLSKESLFLCYP